MNLTKERARITREYLKLSVFVCNMCMVDERERKIFGQQDKTCGNFLNSF